MIYLRALQQATENGLVTAVSERHHFGEERKEIRYAKNENKQRRC
jgi:hypothetical protein